MAIGPEEARKAIDQKVAGQIKFLEEKIDEHLKSNFQYGTTTFKEEVVR